jgi:hypothetical protein
MREVGQNGDGRVTVGNRPYDVSYSPDCNNVSVKNEEVRSFTITNIDAIK